MRFSIITAFPDFFRGFLSESIVGRGLKAGLFDVELVDLRSFGKGAYRQIDDYAFGSGGMVLAPEPLRRALDTLRVEDKPFVVYPTPQGAVLTQEIVETLFHQSHIVIICGHYEGIDERFAEREVDLEVTLGDCVLTGGEIPAMAVIDAVSRLIPGVVGRHEAVEDDSFYRGMLDHPHYTRPASWDGAEVPEVLLSGDAAKIQDWRRNQSVARTLARRPDLLSRSGVGGYVSGGVYLAVCAEGLDAAFLTECGRLCESYGAARLFLIEGDRSRRDELRGAAAGESGRIKLMPSLDRALDWVDDKAGKALLIEVSDEEPEGARHWLEVKRLILEKGGAVVFYFPRDNGDGFDKNNKNNKIFSRCDVSMLPLQGGTLSLYGKLAAVLDRFLGSK